MRSLRCKSRSRSDRVLSGKERSSPIPVARVDRRARLPAVNVPMISSGTRHKLSFLCALVITAKSFPYLVKQIQDPDPCLEVGSRLAKRQLHPNCILGPA